MKLDIVIDDDRWAAALGDVEQFIDRCALATAAQEPRLDGGGALLLTNDAALHRLNKRFRHKDQPTNVLSFPTPETAPQFLGDIAMAFETCEREAMSARLAFPHHAAHLIVHGLLHLIGYDHETDEQAAAMESLEARILADLGVDDPYAPDEKER